jgi:hypothetical protein
MLTTLTTGLRFRLAIMFAFFASLCFVAPPAVAAFGHGTATVDCMAHADKVGHGKMATTQETKHHGDHSTPTRNQQHSCCDLFCMSALAAHDGVIQLVAAPSTPISTLDPILFNRVAERLDRPPISLCIV